jgi:hypothetical protein
MTRNRLIAQLLLVGGTLLAASVSTPSRAEEAAPPPVAPSPTASKPRTAPRNPKGKHAREKEIEGSEARNRFQADTVLKSQYQHNGEPLEVDPD